MVSSGATTVPEYLASLEPAQAAELGRVVEVVREALPDGLDKAWPTA